MKIIHKIGIIDPLVKPRILILSDIGNEPDDQQSLCRFLTYSNEFDIEGLIATTSMWQRDKTRPDLMEKIINVYGGSPRQNLMIHTGDYFPTSEELLPRIKRSIPLYGMLGVGKDQDSEGSECIISVLDKPDPRPLWIPIWGGANCLAQALWKIKNTRNREELNEIIRKIRVYAIFDQDDSGLWLRKTFPELFYIVSPFPFVPNTASDEYEETNPANSAKFNPEKFKIFIQQNFEYSKKATWTGMSGECFYKFEGGPNSTLIKKKWVNENIRNNHGPLGEVYPRVKYAMEGDTPSFLNLIHNGLRSCQNPTYGGWGGRYRLFQPKGETREIYSDTIDTVKVGNEMDEIEGDVPGIYSFGQATIWRWREAYQNDFAARMDWASTPNYKDSNHPPSVIINGLLDKKIKKNEQISLDATGTSDPDDDEIFYHWFYYKEAGTYQGDVIIEEPSAIKTKVSFNEFNSSETVHIILEVKDDGNPCLYRYARIILIME